MNEFEIRVQRSLAWKGFQVFIHNDTKSCREAVTGFKVEQLKPGVMTPPANILTEHQAQTLLNDLWRDGLRPNNEFGSESHIKSVENHLDDMRKIAFHQLKMKV